jgi:hypothetical protein
MEASPRGALATSSESGHPVYGVDRDEGEERGAAGPRRRAREGLRPVPRRRQQPRVSRVFRAARGARDERRSADERAARLRQHALQAAGGLSTASGRGGLGHAAGRAARRARSVQGGPQADAGAAAGAVFAFRSARRVVWLSQPHVLGVGGRRRDRDARDPRRRGGSQDLRRVDGSGRHAAPHRQRVPDDDAAGRVRRAGLHPRARGPALRGHPRADPGFHRPQGRHLRQHRRRPWHRGQDRRPALGDLRLPRRGPRASLRTAPREGARPARARGPSARVQGARDHAPRPPGRLRPRGPGPGAPGPLQDAGDLPSLRAQGAAQAHRCPRRRAPGGRGASRRRGRRVARRAARGSGRGGSRASRPRRAATRSRAMGRWSAGGGRTRSRGGSRGAR